MIKLDQKEYSFLFSKYEKPVLEVEPGELIQASVVDTFSNLVKSVNDKPKQVPRKGPNPQIGPILVKGIKKGDTLACHIHSIELDRDYAVSQISPMMGGLQQTDLTSMLYEPLENRCFIWRRVGDEFVCEGHEEMRCPIEPFCGTMATAPWMEAISTLVPYNQGGNMDVRDVCAGNTVYLPVAVDGGYFFTGDCHAKQGDGELCGTALEIPATVVFSLEKAEGMNAKNPRIESPTHYMAVGCARPLEDAARIAWVELIRWLEEKGWDRMLAYQMLTQVGEMSLGNIVDPNYSMVAKIEKKYADVYLKK